MYVIKILHVNSVKKVIIYKDLLVIRRVVKDIIKMKRNLFVNLVKLIDVKIVLKIKINVNYAKIILN